MGFGGALTPFWQEHARVAEVASEPPAVSHVEAARGLCNFKCCLSYTSYLYFMVFLSHDISVFDQLWAGSGSEARGRNISRAINPISWVCWGCVKPLAGICGGCRR